MTRFEIAFPEFIAASARLHAAFWPYAFVLLVLSFAFEFWRGSVRVIDLLRFLTKLFLIVVLTAHSHEWINGGQLLVDEFLRQHVPARPENVAALYKERLAAVFQDGSIENDSVWEILLSGDVLDAILYAFLVLVSYLAMAVITFVSFVQKLALFTCWAVCPILFALLAIPPLVSLGWAHVMRILSILCWPLGFAVAATFTEGLMNLALKDRVLSQGSFVGNLSTTVESLIIIAIIGLWTMVSTIAAPVFIHRFLVGYAGSAEIVTRTGEYLSGIVLPQVMSSMVQGARSLRQQVERWTPSRAEVPHPPSPAPVPGPASVPSETTLRETPSATDPTLSRRLRELLNRF